MENYTYKNSGVNLENSEKLTEILSQKLTARNILNFAGILPLSCFKGYSLAATTDGIGTKIIPLIERKMFKTIAADLAAMNLNDLVCTGAKPLLFLDYIATNTLEPAQIADFVSELDEILKEYNCMLLGGETSEMGDFIRKGSFDAAGFLVGILKEENAVKPCNVKENDIIIGLKSTGVHSNGFSLIRKLYADKKISEKEFAETLTPTAIYAKEIIQVTEKNLASGLANITGGGILSNLKRAVPKGLTAVLNRNALPKLSVYETLEKYINKAELFNTFNMGAGFVVITKEENLAQNLAILEKFDPFIFGKIEKGKDEKRCKFEDEV